MKFENKFDISVFFDGACPLCSREIEVYKRKDSLHKIEFIDIAAPGFNAEDYGFVARDVRLSLHVKNYQSQKVSKGVDAFLEIWQHLPGGLYKFLFNVVSVPLVKLFLRPCYFVFARYIRPNLPKRKSQCDTDSCAR